MERQSLFICSSSNALDIADAMQENLSTEFEVEIWNQGAFGLSEHLLESLESAAKKHQHAVLVLTADELTVAKEHTYSSSRDNVIFELGFFLGIFGRKRTFVVIETTGSLRTPDYLNGITCAQLNRQSTSPLPVAVGPTCTKIKRAVLQASGKTANEDLVDRLIQGMLMVACRALAIPFTTEETKLRTFIFRKVEAKLICTHFWAPSHVSESIGLTFDINSETEKQVAVVKAAVTRKVCSVSVSVLPDQLGGVHGSIERDLCFILAAPILGPKGEVWGTVDFDASNPRGENILRNEISHNVLFELGKHLYWILSIK